jgi:hypothetical protein
VTLIKYSSLLIAASLVLSSCKKNEADTATEPSYRYMDRVIYFAVPNTGSSNDKNNVFQKETVKDSLKEIELMTGLGEGYFSFEEASQDALPISLNDSYLDDASTQVSFIQILPDTEFTALVNEINGDLPDPNAITVMNSSNKRKFFIVIKAGCFSSASSCGSVGVLGIRAIIARQLSLMTGMSTKDCALYPNEVMCSNPSDTQWGPNSKELWKSSFNNALEVIDNTPSFYDQLFM